MTDEQDFERRRLAYRQAGLAVALYTQGQPLPHLVLDRPKTPAAVESGARGWEIDLGSRARHRVELQIIALWAGPVAEARACFEDREPPQGWEAVREPMAALGRRVTRSPEENDAYLEWLRRRAVGLIDIPQVWSAIDALANALLEKGSLSPDEASDLVAAVQRVSRRRVGLAGLFRNPR